METRERVDCPAKVLELHDDEVTEYAILSHWWGEREVGYDKIVELANMDKEKRDEIRQHDGYQKILDSCNQAEQDGYKWLWVDTCCIDKRSSAELSRPSIPCTSGMKTRKYAMRTSMTSSIHPFPMSLMRGMQTIGRSGSHMGGHYKR